MMYERLALIRELLADDGSLYLHCAPNVSHYLKVLSDEIFGSDNFRNEIVWQRTSAHSSTSVTGRCTKPCSSTRGQSPTRGGPSSRSTTPATLRATRRPTTQRYVSMLDADGISPSTGSLPRCHILNHNLSYPSAG